MVEMVEKLHGRLGKRSVERVRYVYYTESFHSCFVFHSPSARDNTAATREIFHADSCNKSYI